MPEKKRDQKSRQPDASADSSLDEFLKGDEGLSDEDREIAKAQLRIQRHERTASELRRLVRFQSEELEHERARSELVLGVAKDAPGLTYRIPVPGRRRKNPTVSVSLLSDVHAEERVEPDTINGRNEHNLEICDEKLATYWQNVVKLYKKEAAHADIREHIQWIGGDLFTGHIHDELIEVTELTPYESMLWLLPRLKAGLLYLRKEMDCPIVVPWSFGNHGRDGKKPRISKGAEHNLDWLLGRLLMRDKDLAADKSITFRVERGIHTYIDVAGYVIRFGHGDKIRYQGGVGGLTIPLNKAIDAWNKGRRADLDVIGHWHSTLNLLHAVANGSVIGFNAFALAIKALEEVAQQSFFLIDMERRQKTGFFPIHVTKPKRSDPT